LAGYSLILTNTNNAQFFSWPEIPLNLSQLQCKQTSLVKNIISLSISGWAQFKNGSKYLIRLLEHVIWEFNFPLFRKH
jgi:hypothetical protein